LHLIFVCVCNRVRSAFSEFLFPKMMGEKDARLDGRVKVSSAGFIPQKLKDHLARVPVKFPEPFYNRPMAEITRAILFKKGIVVPEEWRSKELNSEMVKDADLVITALPEQKEELISLFPKAQAKIFTIKEMARWDGYLLSEDFTVPPMDDTFWDYVDGNPEYVSKIIALTEEMLIRAYPNILKHLGLR
jgi:protein-tyrosine-phosphatase